MDNITLPKGVRGVDFGTFVLMLANDKLVIASKASRWHYTFQVEPQYSRINLHRTMDNELRESLFRATFDELAALGKTALPALQPALSRLLRPLRSTWLLQHGIVVVLGAWDLPHHLIASGKRRRDKLVINLEHLLEQAELLEDVEDLEQLSSGSRFSLYLRDYPGRSRHIGNGFVLPRVGRRGIPLWVAVEDVKRLMADARALLLPRLYTSSNLEQSHE